MILAFDIGGSRIRAALRQGDGIRPLGEVPTPARDAGAFAGALAGFLRPGLRGVALSVPGVIDPETGRGKVANIPAIDGANLRELLERRLGLPVLALNDADCFALAEAASGAGRGHPVVFGVILGSGIGGGLVIGGRIVSGAGGLTGEWGHGPVLRAPWDLPCPCGQKGCVETIGSARGLERLHLLETGQTLSAPQITAAWAAGEARACATMELWRDLVSGQLAMVVNVLGPSVVPVGGGLSKAPGLVGFLDQALRARILRRHAAPLLVPAICGPDAGLLGAAAAGAAVWGPFD